MKKIIEQGVQDLDRAISGFPTTDKIAYGWWLKQTYHYVCHSTRLLALASSRFSRDPQQDALHYRFSEHVAEERGHEFLASRDLKALGFDLNEFEELPETQAFYQSQYYWIEHVHPIAFFGYVLCLEAFSLSGGVRMYKDALPAFGEKATLFMKVHVQEDVGHLDKALQLVENLPADQREIVLSNFRLSCALYERIYHAIQARISSTSSKIRLKAA